mgnify:CR=1 FL=1
MGKWLYAIECHEPRIVFKEQYDSYEKAEEIAAKYCSKYNVVKVKVLD